MSAGGAELGARLREGDLAAAPAVLNLVENRSEAGRAWGGAARSVPHADALRSTSTGGLQSGSGTRTS